MKCARWRPRRMVTAAPALMSVVVATAALTGCGSQTSKADIVRQAVRAARRSADQFVYEERRAGVTTRVTGAIEDDFRFKALVAYNGAPGYEEIVSDDTLAVRFLDPTRLGDLVDRQHVTGVDLSTSTGLSVPQVLDSGRWVLDPKGAPLRAATGLTDKVLGKDPVFDAVTALDYVDRALGQAQFVDQWNPDALNPIYARSEDFFPKPDRGSGVIRYDLRRPPLPSASDANAAGGQRALPATRHFRKMAVYVKDGRVIRVLERIEVVGKFVDDLDGYIRSFLKEAQVSQDVVAQYHRAVGASTGADRGARELAFLNGLLQRLGAEPVLVRTMDLQLDPGSAPITVALPTTGVVTGSLAVLVASKQSKAAALGQTGGPGEPTTGPSGASTTGPPTQPGPPTPGTPAPVEGAPPAPTSSAPPS